MVTPKPKSNIRKGILIPPGVPDIFLAAENNDLQALEVALEYYDVNARDECEMTPLHYAASTLSNLTIDRLLAHPDIDATLSDKFGRTAATVAHECWNHLSDHFVDKLNPHCYPWLYESSDN